MGTAIDFDRLGRDLARWLTPYIRAEWDLGSASPGLAADYDALTCAAFVSELGSGVLDTATVLFDALAPEGRISSVELAERLQVARPSSIAGALTTPLKRRAKALGLPLLPFDGGQGFSESYGGLPPKEAEAAGLDPERTYWQDRDGIAGRMLNALAEEQERRGEDRVTHADVVKYVDGLDDLISYGQVARELGTHPRLVGQAMRRSPDWFQKGHLVLLDNGQVNPGFSLGPEVAAERIRAMGYEVALVDGIYRVVNPPWQT